VVALLVAADLRPKLVQAFVDLVELNAPPLRCCVVTRLARGGAMVDDDVA
jgi:hypothetical protein